MVRSIFLLSFLVLICISSSLASDLIVGTSFNARLAWNQKAEYAAIPFKKRVKEVFYSDPGLQIIRGIIARDVDHTQASAILTAGGVGYTYANLRLKSERGSGLKYHIEIYV